MKIQEQLEEMAKKICDDYCKYPSHVHSLWLSDNIETEDEKRDYLMEHYCNKCPLMEIL